VLSDGPPPREGSATDCHFCIRPRLPNAKFDGLLGRLEPFSDLRRHLFDQLHTHVFPIE
jgi:hypothetical protein